MEHLRKRKKEVNFVVVFVEVDYASDNQKRHKHLVTTEIAQRKIRIHWPAPTFSAIDLTIVILFFEISGKRFAKSRRKPFSSRHIHFV